MKKKHKDYDQKLGYFGEELAKALKGKEKQSDDKQRAKQAKRRQNS